MVNPLRMLARVSLLLKVTVALLKPPSMMVCAAPPELATVMAFAFEIEILVVGARGYEDCVASGGYVDGGLDRLTCSYVDGRG
jgi:hypothetical protein